MLNDTRHVWPKTLTKKEGKGEGGGRERGGGGSQWWGYN